VEFLVFIRTEVPHDLSEGERQSLIAAEANRARQLSSRGHLVRLWRIPGQLANWGLWRAEDATELHRLLTSLPMWRYMRIEVNALAAHPNDPRASDDDSATAE
jgi:muconolactone D-isomerase